MKPDVKDFAVWACDPGRSLEEKFGAQILIEITLGLWSVGRDKDYRASYEAEVEAKRKRSFNPAYQPHFSPADAARTAERLATMKTFDNGSLDDRPLRDLSFLRFCPPLESFTTNKSEIQDWSPLLHHPTLVNLWIGDAEARDLRVLGQLTSLQVIRLFLGWPWPDLRGLENLSHLRELYFYGNILALQTIPALPHARLVEINQGYQFNVPLRSLQDLPAMPELRLLKLINVALLDGVARYANLLNLVIYGYFSDFEPLAHLNNLTHLTVSGDDFPTIAPLARLPRLHYLQLRSEEPPDLIPLADSPSLHEVSLELAVVVPAELASLNAMFTPWANEFAAHTPRTLAPLRLRQRDQYTEINDDHLALPRDYGEDTGMSESEARWFGREVNRRLNALIGKGWGTIRENSGRHAGTQFITICRPEDIDRIPEILDCLRGAIAAARYPWAFLVDIDPQKWYERDIEEIYNSADEEFNADSAREDWEDDQRRILERKQYLERKYRYRLQQELGHPVNPADFAPPPETPDDEDDTIAAGHEEPPEAPAYDLGADVSVFLTLTESSASVHVTDCEEAEYVLGMKAEPFQPKAS